MRLIVRGSMLSLGVLMGGEKGQLPAAELGIYTFGHNILSTSSSAAE